MTACNPNQFNTFENPDTALAEQLPTRARAQKEYEEGQNL